MDGLSCAEALAGGIRLTFHFAHPFFSLGTGLS